METKNYIIETAAALFSRYGFKSVTMDDIAKELGISKKTIYQHFADKDELVDLLIAEKLTAHTCDMQTYVKKGRDAVHEIFLSLEDVNEWLNTLNPKLFYDLQKYHTKSWLRFKNFKEKNLSICIAENMQRGVEEGLYRADINIDILTQLRLDHASIIYNQYDHYQASKANIAQEMIELTQHFLYGVCNDAGRALINKYQEKLAHTLTN